jgi:hypothetical protein
MPRSFPVYLSRAILKPVGESHVTMRQIDSIRSSCFRCHGILLREHQTHDLTQLDVLQEEVDVHWIPPIVAGWIAFLLDEVFFCDHLDIRIVGVDRDRSSKSDRDRPISGEK